MIKVGSIWSISNTTPLIKVTPSPIQIICSTLSNGRYTIAIQQHFSQHQYQNAFVQYTQRYNGQRSDSLELMLNIMLEWSRAYGQHFYPLLVWVTYVLQSLCSTHSLITHVLQGLCPTHHRNKFCISIFCTINHKNIISVYQGLHPIT